MRQTTTLLVIGSLWLSGYTSVPAQGSDAAVRDPARFTYTRLYCTSDNESHFSDTTVELAKKNFAPPAPPIHIGGSLPATSAFFGGFESNWGASDLKAHLNHPAPAVQFVTILAGTFSITATDGQLRHFRVGDVIRFEDVAPCKGHITVVGNEPGFIMFAR